MYEFRFGMRFIKPRVLNLRDKLHLKSKYVCARACLKRGRNEAALPRRWTLMALVWTDRRSNYNDDITLMTRI